jgi:hypothetical protein
MSSLLSNIKPCAHCNKIFSAAGTGMSTYLCRRCSAECENDFVKVSRYVRDKSSQGQGVDIDTTAAESGVPREFIIALILDGRFPKANFAGVPNLTENNAAHLKLQMMQGEGDTSPKATPEQAQPNAPNAPKKPASGRHSYGLGR